MHRWHILVIGGIVYPREHLTAGMGESLERFADGCLITIQKGHNPIAILIKGPQSFCKYKPKKQLLVLKFKRRTSPTYALSIFISYIPTQYRKDGPFNEVLFQVDRTVYVVSQCTMNSILFHSVPHCSLLFHNADSVVVHIIPSFQSIQFFITIFQVVP
jgi:hypothetical protein